VGENVHIGPLCIIGYPPEWKGKEHNDCGVIIGAGTTITGLVTIDSGAITPTTIGENCYILKKVHIGHDVYIGSNVTISCHAIIGGHSIVGYGSNIGLGAIIHQKKEVPDFTMIGMGGIVVKKSVLESFKIYAGNPVKELSLNTHLIEQYPNEYERYLQNYSAIR
jgi:UDP-N-acetylglucosamine acyltransferase